MNDNQQIQEYKCNGCFKMPPIGGVKRYLLDNDRGVKMYCVLCPECSYTQFSIRQWAGAFPMLASNVFPREIITPEFERHEEDEIKALNFQTPEELWEDLECVRWGIPRNIKK